MTAEGEGAAAHSARSEAQSLIDLAMAASKRQDHESALAHLQAAAALQPHNRSIWLNVAQTLRDLERLDEAADICRKMLARDPQYYPAVRSLLSVLEQQKQFVEAGKFWRENEARFPAEPGFWDMGARIAAARGAWAQSGRAWETAAARSAPEKAARRLRRGLSAFVKAGRFADAARLLGAWKTQEPQALQAQLTAEFELFVAQGDFRDALALVRSNAALPEVAEAFPPARIARTAFEAGLAPEETFALLSQWLPRDAAIAVIDDNYKLNLRTGLDQALDKRKSQLPNSTRAHITAATRDALRRFLRERSYRRFRALFLDADAVEIATQRQFRSLQQIAVRLFPASPLRSLLDHYLESGRIDPDEAAYASRWRASLPRPGNSIAEKLRGLSRQRLICATKVRDEADMLPGFFAHHIALGVRHFIVVDNNSSDGIAEACRGVRDAEIVIVEAPYPFAGNASGMAWINEILETGACDWLLNLDADERLVFPDCENRQLPELLDHFERRGETAMPAFMLDMYDEGYIRDESASGDIAAHDLFYSRYSISKGLRAPYLKVWGGIRSADWDRNHIVKAPLIRAAAQIRYLNSHYVSECVPAETTGVLLHYKVYRDRELMGLAPQSIVELPRIRDRGIEPIARHIEFAERSPRTQASGPFHTRYAGSSQLVRLGYMGVDRDWSAGGTKSTSPAVGRFDDDARSRGSRVEHLVLYQPDFGSLLDALAFSARAGRRDAVRALLLASAPRIRSRAVRLGVLLLCAHLLGLRNAAARIAATLNGVAGRPTEDNESLVRSLEHTSLSDSAAARRVLETLRRPTGG